MKVYIAGKISDLPINEVREKFDAAKQRVKEMGFEPVSPLENGCKSEYWHEQMMACLPLLLECDGIYMLEDWTESQGARIEYTFAQMAGKMIITQEV